MTHHIRNEDRNVSTTDYNATVEVDRRERDGAPTHDELDAMLDKLEPYHGVIAFSRRGFLEATITLPAASLAQACVTAVAVIEAATGHPALTAEVMTTLEFDAREGWEPLPDLVSVTEAAELLGVSRQAVQQRIDAKTLPAVQIGRAWALPRGSLSVGVPGRPPAF